MSDTQVCTHNHYAIMHGRTTKRRVTDRLTDMIKGEGEMAAVLSNGERSAVCNLLPEEPTAQHATSSSTVGVTPPWLSRHCW